MDRLIAGGAPEAPADLHGVRLGMAQPFLANLDADTRAAFPAALTRSAAAGVTIVECDAAPHGLERQRRLPRGVVRSLRRCLGVPRAAGTGITIQQLAAAIASPDVKGTYEGLVLTRKLPGPNGAWSTPRPRTAPRWRRSRPALIQSLCRHLQREPPGCAGLPNRPARRTAGHARGEQHRELPAVHPEHGPGQQCGPPGRCSCRLACGASTRLPVGLEMDGPAGSDRRLLAIGLALGGSEGCRRPLSASLRQCGEPSLIQPTGAEIKLEVREPPVSLPDLAPQPHWHALVRQDR